MLVGVAPGVVSLNTMLTSLSAVGAGIARLRVLGAIDDARSGLATCADGDGFGAGMGIGVGTGLGDGIIIGAAGCGLIDEANRR